MQCYFDDSGTHEASKVVSWGGVMGTVAEISKLDALWRKLLNDPLDGHKPPLKQFHLSHCARSLGEFESYTPAERDAVRYNFRQPIIESGVETIAHAVSIVDWNEIIVGAARGYYGSPEQAAFSECLRAALQFASDCREPEISIFLDRGRMLRPLVERVEIVEKSYSGFSELVAIGFNKIVEFCPLQAADTVATENYWHAKAYLSDSEAAPEPHFQSLLNNVAGRGLIVDREMAIANLASFHRSQLGG